MNSIEELLETEAHRCARTAADRSTRLFLDRLTTALFDLQLPEDMWESCSTYVDSE
ncbi:hypothetical protein ACEZCY_34715 [Streptacidiphilus sp. N1-12]|uniref:Uncharacterized protein n=2 Tax=Streptacidiphilus alkalitolerans TaxID=3342712 RepID=A0ABV6VKQ7_9ACTN